MKQKKLALSILEGRFSILKLKRTLEIPSWAYEGSFFSITRTPEELSVVCQESSIPANDQGNVQAERGWKCLKVEGPLDFGLTGIISGISRALADKGISIFAVSTYDTDYILVREKDLQNAIRALVEEDYEVRKP